MQKNEINYILCPDTSCKLFWDTSRHIPCERECPHNDKMNIMIKCGVCGKDILLKHGHGRWFRVDCDCGGCNFQRMSGKYEWIDKNKYESL